METFGVFLNKKTRDAKRQLGILKEVIHRGGLSIEDFRNEEEPYIFVRNPGVKVSFDGVRIYKIGNTMAYRIQKESKTHPYGKAYSMNLDELYQDLISDKRSEEKAGHEVMQAIVHEIKRFFDKSAKAEKENRASEVQIDRDPFTKVILQSGTIDYGSSFQNMR